MGELVRSEEEQELLLNAIEDFKDKIITKDSRFKEYSMLSDTFEKDKLLISKDVGIGKPICFELLNDKGDTIYIITTFDKRNGALNEVAVIEKDGRIKISEKYARKVNDAAGRKVIDTSEKNYMTKR